MECTYNIKFTWISTTHWNMHRAPPKNGISRPHATWNIKWNVLFTWDPDNSKNPFKGIEIHTQRVIGIKY